MSKNFQTLFDDPLCTEPSHSLTATGRFFISKRRSPIPSSTAITFVITGVLLTPQSIPMAKALRKTSNCGWHVNESSGKYAFWDVGRPVDLTKTGGCRALGIRVPMDARDVVILEESKTGQQLLRTGDFATVEYSSSALPTSLRPALRKCTPILVQLSLITDSTDQQIATFNRRYQMWTSTATKTNSFSLAASITALLIYCMLPVY